MYISHFFPFIFISWRLITILEWFLSYIDMIQRDRVEREVGGGIGKGDTCIFHILSIRLLIDAYLGCCKECHYEL